MSDPVQRMVQFVTGQKRQAAAEHARFVWSRRLAVLVPCVREVVEVLRQGLEEPSEPPLVSVLVDPRHERCPLVIAFRRRDSRREGVLSIRAGAADQEVGASAVFRCEDDGIVYGFRYPFHSVLRDVRPEVFADLGEPGTVSADRLGNAVADFLEWAAVGDGCGARKLRFWSPPASTGVPHRPVNLSLVAA